MKNEKLTRKEIIDDRLKQAGWNVGDRTQVVEEFDITVDSNMVQKLQLFTLSDNLATMNLLLISF